MAEKKTSGEANVADEPVVSVPKHHCQNGRADICLAGSQDGICCSEYECDIDDGFRKAH